jgi:hypothetical protein
MYMRRKIVDTGKKNLHCKITNKLCKFTNNGVKLNFLLQLEEF